MSLTNQPYLTIVAEFVTWNTVSDGPLRGPGVEAQLIDGRSRDPHRLGDGGRPHLRQ
jgi:hypothetical protein